MLLILLTITVILFVAYQEYKYAKIRKATCHIPGPHMLPIIGNSLQLGKTPRDVLNFLFDNWYKYGQKNFRFCVCYYLNIVVTDLEDVEFILTSTTLIGKSNIYDMLYPWLGEGLLTSKGTKWRKHRKLITPSFHFQILQDFHETMNQKSTMFMEKLREASRNDNIFDIQAMMSYLALDIIFETAMGVNMNCVENSDTDFVRAIQYICSSMIMRALDPLKRKTITFKLFPEYKEFCKHLKVLQDLTYDVIEKRMEARKTEACNKANNTATESEHIKPKMAFLDNLLSSTIDGKPLTRQELYEEVSTFIFAGHDTTTSAISFVVFLLSRHLDVQHKAHEEQQRIIGIKNKRDATFAELSDMKYLDLIIKETLRLYPSVPMVARDTEKEYNMNGKIIPPDVSLNIFIMAMGYNDKIFPDPYRFNPERFETHHEKKIFNPYAYVPFSGGPRNCIGQKFAINEIKVVISKILRHFEILPPLDELASADGYVCTKLGPFRNKTPHKYDPVLSTVISLKSDNGIHIRLRERK